MRILKLRNLPLEGDFFVVVDGLVLFHALDLLGGGDVVDAGHFELTDFLQLGQAAGLLDNLLALFAFSFFALGVGQADSHLGEHLFLVLVHVDSIQSCGFGFRIGVDFSWPQLLQVLSLLNGLALGHIQQLLIPVIALRRRPANKRRNGPPLTGEYSGQLQ